MDFRERINYMRLLDEIASSIITIAAGGKGGVKDMFRRAVKRYSPVGKRASVCSERLFRLIIVSYKFVIGDVTAEDFAYMLGLGFGDLSGAKRMLERLSCSGGDLRCIFCISDNHGDYSSLNSLTDHNDQDYHGNRNGYRRKDDSFYREKEGPVRLGRYYLNEWGYFCFWRDTFME